MLGTICGVAVVVVGISASAAPSSRSPRFVRAIWSSTIGKMRSETASPRWLGAVTLGFAVGESRWCSRTIRSAPT